jgi:hypothetical protein
MMSYDMTEAFTHRSGILRRFHFFKVNARGFVWVYIYDRLSSFRGLLEQRLALRLHQA